MLWRYRQSTVVLCSLFAWPAFRWHVLVLQYDQGLRERSYSGCPTSLAQLLYAVVETDGDFVDVVGRIRRLRVLPIPFTCGILVRCWVGFGGSFIGAGVHLVVLYSVLRKTWHQHIIYQSDEDCTD